MHPGTGGLVSRMAVSWNRCRWGQGCGWSGGTFSSLLDSFLGFGNGDSKGCGWQLHPAGSEHPVKRQAGGQAGRGLAPVRGAEMTELLVLPYYPGRGLCGSQDVTWLNPSLPHGGLFL